MEVMVSSSKRALLGLVVSAALAACSGDSQPTAQAVSNDAAAAVSTATHARVDQARLEAAPADQWLTYGGSYQEQRFSTLDQINTSNVSQLGLSWFADYDTNLQQEGTPLYIDGVIYVS